MESEACTMLDEYDFSKARKNPYAKALKKQITLKPAYYRHKNIILNVGMPPQIIVQMID